MSTAFFRYVLPLLATAALSQTTARLEIVSYTVDPATGVSSAKVFNSSRKTTVATTLAVSCGSRTAFVMHDSSPGDADSPDQGIRPGDTAERQLPCAPSSKDAIRVSAAVYEDGTVEGDETQIADIFRARGRYVRTLKAQRDALSAPDFQTALSKLHELKKNRDLDESLIGGTEISLMQRQKRGGTYQDFRNSLVGLMAEQIPVAETRARRAQ